MVFYLAINVAPTNVDYLYIYIQEKSGKPIKIDLIKQKNGQWKAIPDKKLDDPMYFRFDEDLNFYTYTKSKSEPQDTIPMGTFLNVKKNHKKWESVTQITFERKKDNGGNQKKLTFEISSGGKRKRFIQPIDKKDLLPMIVTWK